MSSIWSKSEIEILADIPSRMRCLARSIASSQDEHRGYLTWFFYRLRDKPVRAEHSMWDLSDQTFRALDALCSYRGLTGSCEFDVAIERFVYWALESLRIGDGLNFRFPDEFSKEPYTFAHDLGRGLMGLMSLTLHYDKYRFTPLLSKFVDRLIRFWSRYDKAYGQIITSDWTFIPIEWNYYDGEVTQPQTSGRSIQAMLRYYKWFLKDERVLEIAEKLAKVNVESAFNQDGTIRRGYAGSHFHSITGLTTALIDLAMIKNDKNLLEKAKNVFDKGLKPFRTSFGWAKENLDQEEPEGEVCATADLAQSALGLGLAGYTEYFQEAERIARNHLLATQLLDPLDFLGTEGRSKEELALIERTYGLVSGWGLPNQFVARRHNMFDAMLCCSHQSVQALHDLWCYATTLDEEGLWVNLHFSLETEHAYVECRVPFQGYLKVKPKGSWNLYVRVPSFTDPSDVDIKVDGKSTTPSEKKGFLNIGMVEKGSEIELNFPLKLYTVKEEVANEVYETTWISDTVIDIDPKGKDYPIYSNRKVILKSRHRSIDNLL